MTLPVSEQQAAPAWLDNNTYCYSGRTLMVEATAYCPCSICCGKSDGITNSGKRAYANHTIAVDPSIIPLGTMVYLEGLGTFIAEDTGGAIKGHKVDLFMNEHRQALNFGIKNIRAHLLKEAI